KTNFRAMGRFYLRPRKRRSMCQLRYLEIVTAHRKKCKIRILNSGRTENLRPRQRANPLVSAEPGEPLHPFRSRRGLRAACAPGRAVCAAAFRILEKR